MPGRVLLAFLAAACCGSAATRILVTVIEQRSAQPVTDLGAADFTITDSDAVRRVEAAEYATAPVDMMLLVDSSLVGGMVQPVAVDLISQLQDKEQMALVAYHSAADLVQDFTSSKDLLKQALSRIKYGNEPRALDAIFAAADGGFQGAVLRRVILLLTTGVEGYGRVSERSVIRLARRNGISIYTLYMSGQERGLFESLARNTGGAAMSIREIGRAGAKAPERVFAVIRGNYTLTLAGNLAVGERLKVEVNRKGRYQVSALPLE
jgi:Mg-chelatase subunit ChlD